MALGMAGGTGVAILNAICRNTSYVVATGPYVKLHTGDPGAAGASNAATETTRQLAVFGSTATFSAGVVTIANTAVITWAGIAGSQDATHFSLWDASTAGTFLGSGIITANAYVAGDTYNIGIGGATLTLACAA